jgi:hypothetical protein
MQANRPRQSSGRVQDPQPFSLIVIGRKNEACMGRQKFLAQDYRPRLHARNNLFREIVDRDRCA